MLTSSRTFGVEIEFYTNSLPKLSKISGLINVVRDGSLDGLTGAGEYVSPKLTGAAGESELKKACGILKANGAITDNEKTSVHVHLDGKKSSPVLRSSRKKPTGNVGFCVAVSNRIKAEFSVAFIREVLLGNTLPGRDVCRSTHFNGVTYFSKGELESEPKINYTFYYLENTSRFEWLQKVFYFYTLYSPVLESIVSDSRKFGNMYCIPLHKSYDLSDIQACKNEDELHSVWYKGRFPDGHYDDSRYHNVNLHSYWDRHRTVEIRSHGGTTDPIKILLWVRLHQKIVDKLEDVSLASLVVEPGTDLHKSFLDFIEEPVLQAYVKRLLGFYSDVKIA